MKSVWGLFIYCFFISATLASQYPASFYEENVLIAHDGPAFLSYSYSGYAKSKLFIGYKKTGMFSDKPHLDVFIKAKCEDLYVSHGMAYSTTRNIKITPEWHGNGLLSYPLDIRDLFKNMISLSDGTSHFIYCDKIIDLEMAFSFEGSWDSLYGKNYHFSEEDLASKMIYGKFEVSQKKMIVKTGYNFFPYSPSDEALRLMGEELKN